MNYMKQVAEMLGVEIGEKFKIEGFSDNIRFRLTEKDIEIISYGRCVAVPIVLRYLLNGKYKVVKIPKPILDDVEKRYLSRVIRPWRDKVEYIRKINFDDEDEFIVIIYRERESKAMALPCFKKGTMYKGTEVGKEYSLEELGL